MTSRDEKLPLLGKQSSLFSRLSCLVLKIQGVCRSKQTNISVSNIFRSWFSYYSLTIYIADKRKLRGNFITFQMLSVTSTWMFSVHYHDSCIFVLYSESIGIVLGYIKYNFFPQSQFKIRRRNIWLKVTTRYYFRK